MHENAPAKSVRECLIGIDPGAHDLSGGKLNLCACFTQRIVHTKSDTHDAISMRKTASTRGKAGCRAFQVMTPMKPTQPANKSAPAGHRRMISSVATQHRRIDSNAV
jgi:hypothetical protein